MTEIFLIRHVQAEGNLYRLMQGHWNGEVTELGRLQRDALAERFKTVSVDAVYSSDISRAVFTAEAITKYKNIPLRLDERLREINCGPWEGMPFANIKWEQPQTFEKFIGLSDDFYLDGAETFQQVRERMIEALTDIAVNNEGHTVVVTSHGVAIRCLMSGLFGASLGGSGFDGVFVNTGVARIVYENGSFTLDYANDSSHLGELARTHATIPVMFRDEFIDPREHRDYYIDCYEKAWLAAHGDLRGFDPEPYYLAAIGHHKADPRSVSMIYFNDEPVGLLDLDSEKGVHASYGWISLLYLKEEYRRQNYGVQLIGRAIAKYDLMGRRSIRLLVSEDNQAALSFYRKWGFHTLSTQNGTHGKLLLMEKRLRGYSYGNV